MSKKTILITGCDSGIGKASVEWFRSQGYHVIACVLKKESQKKWSEKNVLSFVVDITNDNDIKSLTESLSKKNIEIDMLVNNAGVSIWGPILDIPEYYWIETFKINVIGQVKIIKNLLPYMNRKDGKIILIGSTSGRIGLPLFGAYPLTKISVSRLSDTLRRELRLIKEYENLKVSLVEPGSIKTPIWEKAKEICFEKGPLFDLAQKNGLELIEKEYERATNPQKVAKLFEKILLSKRPRRRYIIGKGGYAVAFMGFLPIFLQDYLIGLMTRIQFGKKVK